MDNILSQSVLEGEVIENPQTNLISLFKYKSLQYLQDVAVIHEDSSGNCNSITFEKMEALSNQMSWVLKYYYKLSKSKCHVVVVSLKPTENLPVILLAVLKAGLSYLPIDLEFPIDRIKYILQDSQPLLCIIEEEVDKNIYNNILTLSDKQLLYKSKNESEEIQFEESYSNIALVLYTSGSTGVPKGVRLTHAALLNRLNWQWRVFPYNHNEKYCIFKTALTFVDSVCEIWSPLIHGRALVVVSKESTKDPSKFISILNKYKIQRIVLVPSLLKSLLMYLKMQEDKNSLKELKLWVCSGEMLLPSIVKDFFNWFSHQRKVIANFYGSTEIMGDVTYYVIQEDDPYILKQNIPIGKPVDNCVIYIVDENLKIVPCGNIGELLIAGKNLADGYVKEDNAKKFFKNPFSLSEDYSTVFKTGDYAKIEDAVLFYEGRQDNQIKIRGHRVDLSEIQKVVLQIPAVEDATVLPYLNNNLEHILLCFIVPKNMNTNFDKEKVANVLCQNLASYMVPKLIVIKKFPLLTNGKIDRQHLLEFYKKSLIEDVFVTQKYNLEDVPQEHLEKAKIVFEIISPIIGINNKVQIKGSSNFYDLGGNSLNSVYTVLKLREKGLNISITDFITANNMNDILKKINSFSDKSNDTEESSEIISEMLNDSHKEDVINMITESFFTKADLEQWLIPDIKKDDYYELMQELWEPLVTKMYSFVLKNVSNNKILSVSLNFDAEDEPNVEIKSKLSVIFEFLEFLEMPIRETQLPKGKKKIFHTFMMATSNDLKAAENVNVMRLMEEKCLEIAKANGFAGILTTNTSPLTQQLGTDVFNYEVMLDYQVNKYVTTDGLKPFSKAPIEQRAVVSWKSIVSK